MFNKSKILLLGCLVLFQFCSNNKPTITPEKAESFSQYEFTKIIPKNIQGRIQFHYTLAQEITSKAQLKIIENGYDSIFIRLLYIYNGPLYQGIDLWKTKGNWGAEFYTLQEIKQKDAYLIQKKDSSFKSPKAGWESFIPRLYALNITEIPLRIAAPHYQSPTDAPFVIVQIATQSKYRTYSYAFPLGFPEIKAAKNIEDIMELIEEQFGIQRLEKF